MVLVSLSSARPFPRNQRARFTHDNDEKPKVYYDKASNRPKSGLTMIVKTGRLRQVINDLRQIGTTSGHARQEYVSLIAVAALQE